MWKSITTIIMVLLALAGRSEAQGSSPTDEQAVRSNVDAWMAAWNNGDANAIAQLVTEDYEVVLPDGTHIKGRGLTRRFWRAMSHAGRQHPVGA
jgi:ketosteroid isomerase-like protein